MRGDPLPQFGLRCRCFRARSRQPLPAQEIAAISHLVSDDRQPRRRLRYHQGVL